MKKIIIVFVIIIFAVWFLCGCDKERTSAIENLNTTEVEETEPAVEDVDSTGPTEGDTIRPVVLYEDWECFVSDRLTIRLHLYPLENKYYEIKEPSNGGPNVLFGHELWTYYEIRNDTMYIKDSPDDDFRYNWLCCKFFITMHSETVMEMDYMGALPAIPTKTNYLFIRKN